MSRAELLDKVARAMVAMLLTINPQQREYYRAVLKHYGNESATEQSERELDKTLRGQSTPPPSWRAARRVLPGPSMDSRGGKVSPVSAQSGQAHLP